MHVTCVLRLVQEAGLIDDRFRRGARCDGSSATNTQSQVADSFNDSIELGMPHEPLSITFFKTAFSMSNMTGRRKDLPPEYLENMRLYELGIIEVMPQNPAEPPAPISNALLDGLNADTLARLQAQRREQDMDGAGACCACCEGACVPGQHHAACARRGQRGACMACERHTAVAERNTAGMPRPRLRLRVAPARMTLLLPAPCMQLPSR